MVKGEEEELLWYRVKSGDNDSKSLNEVFKDKKIDYRLLVKGKHYGSKNIENKITIPIYLFSRFKFNLGGSINENKIDVDMSVIQDMDIFKK